MARPTTITRLLDDPRVSTRAIDVAARANDASHYLLTPQGVATASDIADVANLMRLATRSGTPLTFRSGGTSLSGQASGAGVLVDVRRAFRRVTVQGGGARVRTEPGATVRQVNTALARHGFRLGPDPASEAACTIGGVVSNNSSGMACGTTENAYETLDALVFALPSGTIVDTAAPDADRDLAAREPALVAGLERLRRRVMDNPESVRRIRQAFAMKNTMGYGLNAFLDHASPTQLLAHLIVGSEGTLAFVGEATFRTVPVRPHAATALALFADLDAATRALPALVESGAAALELMDATSIRVGQALPGAPEAIMGFTATTEAALLVEYQAADGTALAEATARGTRALAEAGTLSPVSPSTDPVARQAAWRFRKGLYASIAGARPAGTTALLEDVVVPVDKLADTCAGLQDLFARHAYADSVIFGHAKDGNIHFMLTDRFETPEQTARLAAFTEDMADLILGAGGNLKAEHGTGRAMAPFVRRQYGDELYDVMVALKRLVDPAAILNPGVIIEDDPSAHLRHIKVTEPIEQEADRCVECGYCEPVCPSRDLTLTPRQRIVARRAIAAADARGDAALAAELRRDYDYEGVATCAVDGMCQTACPVLIDTGALVKRLRREAQGPVANAAWNAAARAWGPGTRVASAALTAARAAPRVATAATDLARRAAGDDAVPRYTRDLPPGGRARSRLARGSAPDAPAAVYLPACVNTMFGAAGSGIGVGEALVRLAERAGVSLAVPEGIDAVCCSTPWTSKGMTRGRSTMSARLARVVRAAAGATDVTIISDASSCSEGFAHALADEGVTAHVEDAVSFAHRVLLPRLAPTRVADRLVLHPTCSSYQMGIDGALRALGEAVAREAVVPDAWGCCGFAGDRGMLHPELTAAATAAEAAEVAALAGDAHASCNRTCELGMTRATGETYAHVLELLERATR
ncbi:FAD-binding and (Fe-S)-binding domain-containing protein [Microbacterium excoecariae]|uniref:FAD-binding and (Fe-S)-binding domain-containing protein n=1 Tax=Microbacterium excoecariae TaxID=2715210 RepID=UPI001407A2D1|nr:FAD-binding and (Fe-S)-binding domain-containing protein [Microbacterium excoecariae]